MIKVLWLCNIVLPEISDAFGFRRVNAGGWLTGMWKELKGLPNLDLGICVPIRDKERMKDGVLENYQYYSFHYLNEEAALKEMVDRFCEIIECFQPDVIHIWGTEYMHSLALVLAAERLGILDRVVVNIQGLLDMYAIHYSMGLSDEIIQKKTKGVSIQDRIEEFKSRAKYEKACLNMVKHVIGRTTWDKASVLQMNSKLQYHFCNEVLRSAFYKNAGSWNYKDCKKHTIFISQASYPIKGFHTFLEGLCIIKNNFPDVKVYVAGNEPRPEIDAYGEYIRQRIESLDLTEQIEFLGVLSEDEMCEWFKRCNVFVSPSTIENSSNSICEAAMMGVPIVSSNVGGTSDMLVDKVDGYLYPYNEYYMMAHYVGELFENKDRICELFSNSACMRMKKLNDPKVNAGKTFEIYERISEKNCLQ